MCMALYDISRDLQTVEAQAEFLLVATNVKGWKRITPILAMDAVVLALKVRASALDGGLEEL